MKPEPIPPQSVEIEASILGSLLLDARSMEQIVSILPVEAFYSLPHQHIYRGTLDLHHQQATIDLLTLENWLTAKKLLQSYARIVLDKYVRRQLIAAGREIAERGYDQSEELAELLATSERQISEIVRHQIADRFNPQTLRECGIEVWEKIKQGESPTISTGLESLDKLTGGMVIGDLIVIAARASMGKTWLGCHLADRVATAKMPVVFFSAEMTKAQLFKRFLSMHSGIDSQRLIINKVYKSEYELLAQTLKEFNNLPIIIDDTPAELQTPQRMRSTLRQIRSEYGSIGLIVMDYIQKLGDRAANNRAQTIGKYSGAFKDMAKEFECPFVALAQINRGVESQANKRPSMADIKDSGDIEQDMDLGLLLYRDEYYRENTKDAGVMEIIVSKNRNGATGTCKVRFNPVCGKFSALD
jgi:replicative DNA helicase